MKLSAEQMRQICLGAVRVTETESGVRFFRFTEEQEELYRQTDADYYKKSLTAAGVKLCFETDSPFLFLKVHVTANSSRRYFSFDVKIDGKPVGALDNFSDVTLPQNYTETLLPVGEFSKTFDLGEGSKKVCIYLPWNEIVEIRELSLADGSLATPVKYEKKLLAFGDSITQGYDAQRPSNRYAARLAEALDAEEVNKGIGGEIFFPALANTRESFEPDYISVAYGTNDWNTTTEEDFRERCAAFFAGLTKNYPQARIFAITPIWRKDWKEERPFGDFEKVAEDIEMIAEEFPNITCIRGLEFLPQEETLYADLYLHPNDAGFEHYFRNLSEGLKALGVL